MVRTPSTYGGLRSKVSYLEDNFAAWLLDISLAV